MERYFKKLGCKSVDEGPGMPTLETKSVDEGVPKTSAVESKGVGEGVPSRATGVSLEPPAK